MNGMLNLTFAAYVNRKPYIGETKNRSELWAAIPVFFNVLSQVGDGEARRGFTRYLDVKAFGLLATRIQETSLNVGDSLIVVGQDIESRIWIGKDGKPHASTAIIARSIELQPTAERVAAFIAA